MNDTAKVPLGYHCHEWRICASDISVLVAIRRGTADNVIFGRPLTGWAEHRAYQIAECKARYEARCRAAGL